MTSLLLAAGTRRAQAGPRPNILIVILDDLRWDEVGIMGQVTDLAANGATFKDAYAGNPSCCPSRASLLTGLYSHNTGVWTNGPGPLGGFDAFDDRWTLGVKFQRAGYTTGFVGKYLNGYRGTSYVPPGWDYWRGLQGGASYVDFVLIEDGIAVQHSGYVTDVLTREAERFIDDAAPPWFLIVSHIAPHRQAVPAPRHVGAFAGIDRWRPPSYNERDMDDKPLWMRRIQFLATEARHDTDDLRERRLETLLAADESLATLVPAADIVVFISDNGFLYGEHRLVGKGVPYLEAERVPLVISGLGGPSIVRETVSNVDLAPTLYEAAGISYRNLDGESLLPMIAGDRDISRFELLERAVGARRPAYCGLVGRRWHVVFYSTGEIELYDLRSDPYQLTSVAAAHRGLVNDLRERAVRRCDPVPPGFSWPE
jgi:arylsulfatase A-like enzyme